MFSRALKQPLWKYEYSKNKKLFSLKFELNSRKIGEVMELISDKVSASSQERFVKILLILWNTFV